MREAIVKSAVVGIAIISILMAALYVATMRESYLECKLKSTPIYSHVHCYPRMPDA